MLYALLESTRSDIGMTEATDSPSCYSGRGSPGLGRAPKQGQRYECRASSSRN